MKTKWSSVERMMWISISFTLFLVAFRFLYFAQLQFGFYLWNLFLAILPLLLSRQLYKQKKLNLKALIILACWLLVLPNAPYIITDIFHFFERPPVPKWFDLLLVTSAAWNGLMLGIVSLMQVEQFLAIHFSSWKVNAYISGILLLTAYGIYIGRFLRFNSWDVLTNSSSLARQLGSSFLFPWRHVSTWAFTIFFSAFFWLVYYTIKKISSVTAGGI